MARRPHPLIGLGQVFPLAHVLSCTKHIKDDIERIKASCGNEKCSSKDIFESVSKRISGLIDANNAEEFDTMGTKLGRNGTRPFSCILKPVLILEKVSVPDLQQ